MNEQNRRRLPWSLDWNLLRTFLVVVDRGGVTAAANALGLTQPTVSSALKRLEESLGRRLIERHTRSFEPTPAGLKLAAECNKMLGIVSHIPHLIDEAAEAVTGDISLAMTSHVVSHHLDDLLAAFDAKHPDVGWSIPIMESREVVNRIRQGRASLGVCLLEKEESRLETRLLYRQRFRLYCGRHHRLFGRADIGAADLAGEDSISFQTDTQTGPLFSVHDLRHRMRLNPQLKGVSANLPEVRRMIIAGIGIGALPVHVAQKDVAAGQLWPLPPAEALPVVDIHVVWNPQRRRNRAEDRLVEMVAELLDTVPLAERCY